MYRYIQERVLKEDCPPVVQDRNKLAFLEAQFIVFRGFEVVERPHFPHDVTGSIRRTFLKDAEEKMRQMRQDQVRNEGDKSSCDSHDETLQSQ